MKQADKLTFTGVLVNTLLFALKAAAAVTSQSLAVISDTLNSLLDIVSYTLIYVSVKVSGKKADHDHPFGHHRAEPLAAVVIAIFAGILGFEVIKEAALGLLNHRDGVVYGVFPIAVLTVSVIVKTVMAYYYSRVGKKLNSPAIQAGAVDSVNDILVSSVAVAGYVGGNYVAPQFDEVAALLIGAWILKSGYSIGVKNINYLMGKSPSKKVSEEIKKRAEAVDGVHGLNTVRAHYVGNYVQVEVHIEVDGSLSTQQSHEIAKRVQKAVEDMPSVTNAFVHVDPT